jgi:hypothetical protein
MTIKAKIYVGVRDLGNFVRNVEEDDNELVYSFFTSARKPTKKSHPKFHLVVGPFPTERSAEVFRDIEGINSVEEAVRYNTPR